MYVRDPNCKSKTYLMKYSVYLSGNLFSLDYLSSSSFTFSSLFSLPSPSSLLFYTSEVALLFLSIAELKRESKQNLLFFFFMQCLLDLHHYYSVVHAPFPLPIGVWVIFIHFHVLLFSYLRLFVTNIIYSYKLVSDFLLHSHWHETDKIIAVI